MAKPFIFISYRRDDTAGYAGRLEEALERCCGRGSVFRDVRDINAGDPFADVVKAALSSARIVIVLIGPRWAGPTPDGMRRIDRVEDVVRLEVVTALNSGCKVIPVLLSGTDLPRVEGLPEPIRPLLQRQALFLSEESWDADMERLLAAAGAQPLRNRRWVALAAGLALLALAGAALVWYRPAPVNASATSRVEAAERLLGNWQAHVRYGWGDEADETFHFERFAGQLTGTASFLAYPRAIADLHIEGEDLRFVTRTTQTMNGEERQVTHAYTAELHGDELHMRMQSTGGFDSFPPHDFKARRVSPEAGGNR